MPIDNKALESERDLVKALIYLESLAIECLRDGRHNLCSLMEDHAADIRAALVFGKQPVRGSEK